MYLMLSCCVVLANRSQFFQGVFLPTLLMASKNIPNLLAQRITQGLIDSWWMQGMNVRHKNLYDCSKLFRRRILPKT
jgi:hypothetical protein